MAKAIAVLCALAFCLGVWSADDGVPSREPTPEETLILELMNRFRADPSAEADRIAPGGDKVDGYMGKNVDWAMFKSEMKALKPAPPLVFNLELLDCARKHSKYMIQNELTHVEQPGKPGFVAAEFAERCRLAGYTGDPGGENCFRDAGNPSHSHAGFVVDFGEGPGGMQPTRGHRRNMADPSFREVGCSAVPHGDHLSVTHNFGRRSARLVGGVIYFDRNKNNFYDIGEGVGGVTIVASDGSTTNSWKSGAFTLSLKGTQPVTITAEYADQKYSQSIAAGSENAKFDWVVPEQAAIDKANKLLAGLEKVKDPNSSAWFAAAVALYAGTCELSLSPELQAKVGELTQKIGAELQEHQKAVQEAFNQIDAKTWPRIVADNRKPYRTTVVDAWFKDAEQAGLAKLAFANFEKQASVTPPTDRRAFVKQLEGLQAQMTTASFKQEVAGLISQAKAYDAPPGRSGRRRR